MKELLDKIQILIEQNMNEDVDIQKKILEPLFNDAYAQCHNDDIDIKELLKLSQLENQLTKRILKVNPKIEPSNNINESDKMIEQVIYYSRKKAQEMYHCSIINDSLKARSRDFCSIVLDTAKSLGITATSFTFIDYFNLPLKHNIVVAYIDNNYYLIDITYQQFFLLGYNFKGRYYEHPTCTKVCEVGGRMGGSRIDTAIRLIENGYIKEQSDIKNYFDAFMEFTNQEKLANGNEYLKTLLESLKGSNDKSERVLYSKMNF